MAVTRGTGGRNPIKARREDILSQLQDQLGPPGSSRPSGSRGSPLGALPPPAVRSQLPPEGFGSARSRFMAPGIQLPVNEVTPSQGLQDIMENLAQGTLRRKAGDRHLMDTVLGGLVGSNAALPRQLPEYDEFRQQLLQLIGGGNR